MLDGGGASPQPFPNSVVTASTMKIAARNGISLVIRQNFALRRLVPAAIRLRLTAR